MAELKVCRICLQSGKNVYKYDVFQLKLYYEELTALKIKRKDELPQYFCSECATLLHEFHKFKQKCHQGQKVLKALLLNGPITYEVIDRFDRKSVYLQSMLDINTVHKHAKHVFLINDTNNDDNVIKFMPEVNNAEIDGNSNEKDIKDELNNDDADFDERPEVNNEVIDEFSSISSLLTCYEKIKVDDLNNDDADDDERPEVNNDEIDGNSNEKNIEDDFNNDDAIDDERPKVNNDKIDGNSNDNIEDDLNIESIKKLSHTINRLITKAIGSIKDENCDSEKKCTESSPDNITKNTSKKVIRKRESKKTENIRKINMQTKHKLRKIQKQCLNPGQWRKRSLTEEEAVTEFEKRARNLKYIQATYRCKNCYKFFPKNEMMIRHMRSKHNPLIGPFECRFCRTRFAFVGLLDNHTRTHDTKYECRECNFVVTSELAARRHEETHLGIIRTCNLCGKKFRNVTSWYSHLRNHRSKHVCSTCGASFATFAGLRRHGGLKHAAETNKSEVQQDSETFCERCQITFETRNAYEEHLKSSALHADTQNAASKKRRSNDRKPTTCYQCGKHFDSRNLCLRHQRKEHPGTSFYSPNERHICKFCGASISPKSITWHYNTHTRETLYDCDTCDRQFLSPAGLKRHRVMHIPLHLRESHCCDECGKKFDSSLKLKLHLRMHIPIHLRKSHCCDECGKKFESSTKLKRHLETHAGKTSSKAVR